MNEHDQQGLANNFTIMISMILQGLTVKNQLNRIQYNTTHNTILFKYNSRISAVVLYLNRERVLGKPNPADKLSIDAINQAW